MHMVVGGGQLGHGRQDCISIRIRMAVRDSEAYIFLCLSTTTMFSFTLVRPPKTLDPKYYHALSGYHDRPIR